MPLEEFPGPDGWLSDPEDDDKAGLTRISVDVPSLRLRAKALISSQFTPAKEREAMALIEEAAVVDSKLTMWAVSLPETCTYKSVVVPRAPSVTPADAETWLGPIHVYEDLYIAAFVNQYRMLRISCQEIIMACARWLAQETDNSSMNGRITFSRAVLQQMIDGICASVPYHVSYDLERRAQELGQDASGMLLLYPLDLRKAADRCGSHIHHGRLSDHAAAHRGVWEELHTRRPA